MKSTDLFESVMEYIDSHIEEPSDDIKKGFARKYGLDSNAFGKVFNFMTGETLASYIRKRKLYFASRKLRLEPTICISDIAAMYGFYDQSAFTNAFRKEFNFTPNHVRIAGIVCPDKRCNWESLVSPEKEARKSFLDKVFDDFDTYGIVTGYKSQYLSEFIDLSNEYDFDADTCYAIAELSERLSIPLAAMFSVCFHAYIDAATDTADLPPDIEAAIDLGLIPGEDIDEICTFFGCKYYELDQLSVRAYRKKLDVETYLILRKDYKLEDSEITPDAIISFRKGTLCRKENGVSCTDLWL